MENTEQAVAVVAPRQVIGDSHRGLTNDMLERVQTLLKSKPTLVSYAATSDYFNMETAKLKADGIEIEIILRERSH